MCNLPNRKKEAKHVPDFKAPKATKEQAIAASEHSLITSNNIVNCSVCLSQMHVNSLKLQEFLESACVPVAPPSAHNNQMLNAPLRIGKKVTHETHAMYA